ncbi:MAG: tripartite tricarboxylate transporter substrate binding protein [Xanthobacteraceae bacterium]|jgi:tripartite-type tricarboxylate transporter receptor subunit TctC
MRPFALLTALLVLAFPARAQDYPSRLIKLIQGFPPGGNVEFVARLLGHEMSKSLGQAIIVESKPGQAGSLAAEAVANAEPDGYTLLLVSGAHPATAAIYKKLKYDPVDAFAWISTASFYPFIVCVRSDSKWASFVDLLAAARAAPGKVSSGTAGNGSIAHMTTELIAKTAGVKFLSVPYRGEAMAVTGLLSGDVDFVLATAALAIPHVRSGVVKALAVTGKSRWKDIPQVATVAEQGLPDFEVISWSGLAAPARTPQPIIERLHGEIEKAISVDDVRSKLEAAGSEVRATSPAEMRALVDRQVRMWSEVAREARIELD